MSRMPGTYHAANERRRLVWLYLDLGWSPKWIAAELGISAAPCATG